MGASIFPHMVDFAVFSSVPQKINQDLIQMWKTPTDFSEGWISFWVFKKLTFYLQLG